MTDNLTAQIERIAYSNKENGFTIARVKVSGQRDLITVVGSLMSPMPGEIIKMQGEWINHPKYGKQFKLVSYKTVLPVTSYGIHKYLSSGLIKGIGPVIAGRIVNKYGKSSLNIIEDDIEKLVEVEGIGKNRIEKIRIAWDEQKEIRDVMLFLQTHSVGSGYATKIFRQYGNQSIALIQENPYRLAADIFGIGFTIADEIAGKLGFAKNSTLRSEAGIKYILHKLADEGNVYYPYEFLLDKCQEILQIDREVIAESLDKIILAKQVILEELKDQNEAFRGNNKAVYLKKYYVCETSIAFRLKTLIGGPKIFHDIDLERAVEWVQKKLSINLAEKQLEALKCSVENKVVVITGGPGTGKTTVINAIIKIFSKMKLRIMLTAPTGRAAKRMSEVTNYEAKTIHRLLEFSFKKGGFQKNENKPLDCDLLIVDEASMIDTVLMHHLLKAAPPRATFILVGDVHQLPSVGAGSILNDIIESGSVSVVKLKDIFRQAKDSQIIVNAHKINRGVIPSFKEPTSTNDFYFIQQEDPEKVLEIVLELTRDRIPSRFNFDPVEDIQVLTPMHRGLVGSGNLNQKLQATLNPGEDIVIKGDRGFRINDKVMQIKNNYDKEVFNGDIGKITNIITDEQILFISFDDREVSYGFAELDEIVLAYAVSVHKSQGSEYPAVIIPILIQHYMLLQRNLIYTAVTRGKKLVVMVGTKKALAIGINNNKTQKRYTYLQHRLKS